MRSGVNVRLKVDLTKYLNGLVVGTKGITIGEYDIWSKNMPGKFVGVRFPGIGKLDVLIDSLEIIDEDYTNEIKKQEAERLEEYKSAKDIVITLGPLGGFKYLHFEYQTKDGINSSIGIGFKKEAEEIIEYFKKLKKHINIEIEEKRR